MGKIKVPHKIAKAAYGLQEYCKEKDKENTCSNCPVGRDDNGDCNLEFITIRGGAYTPKDWGLDGGVVDE